MPSIHDSLLVGCVVDGESGTIRVHTKPHRDGGEAVIDIVFRGVVAYDIEADCFGNIVFGIEEISIDDLVGDGASFLEKHRLYGWPRGWGPDQESAGAFFSRSAVRIYQLTCSYGMSAWFAASSMEQVVLGAESERSPRESA